MQKMEYLTEHLKELFLKSFKPLYIWVHLSYGSTSLSTFSTTTKFCEFELIFASGKYQMWQKKKRRTTIRNYQEISFLPQLPQKLWGLGESQVWASLKISVLGWLQFRVTRGKHLGCSRGSPLPSRGAMPSASQPPFQTQKRWISLILCDSTHFFILCIISNLNCDTAFKSAIIQFTVTWSEI